MTAWKGWPVPRRNGYDLILLDGSLHGNDSAELLQQIRDSSPHTAIVVTGCTSVKSVIKALRLGACDFIAEPLRLEEVQAVVQRVAERNGATSEPRPPFLFPTDKATAPPLRDVERAYGQVRPELTEWNRTEAAKILGLDRKTVHNKIREFRLEEPSD